MNSFLAPIFAVIFWSGNTVVTKLSAGVVEPGAIGFYRCCVAVLVMSPFLLPGLIRKKSQVFSALPQLAILGLLGTTLYQGLAYFAAGLTTATNMGIITSFIPLATIALSSLILKEKLNRIATLGSLIALCGLFILVTQGMPDRFFFFFLTE